MDNVACYGLEDKLIDCGYHTDTTEDEHSHDIWINCHTTEQSSDQTTSTARAALAVSLVVLVVAVVSIVVFIIIVVVLFKYKIGTNMTER